MDLDGGGLSTGAIAALAVNVGLSPGIREFAGIRGDRHRGGRDDREATAARFCPGDGAGAGLVVDHGAIERGRDPNRDGNGSAGIIDATGAGPRPQGQWPRADRGSSGHHSPNPTPGFRSNHAPSGDLSPAADGRSAGHSGANERTGTVESAPGLA